MLDDILLLARGSLAALVSLTRSGVMDFRDLRVAADAERASATGP
ncbi:MAG TPA: hypothetical protein VF062_14630 [Candidatus Limnocylindrales bacterium]